VIVLCDLDDTLCDARRRMPLWGDWDAFYADAINDPPIVPMIHLINGVALKRKVVIVTAREERFRQMTMTWLIRNTINASGLIMRPENNYMRSAELKVMIAKDKLGKEFNQVDLVIDDRDDVLAAFRGLGIMTLQTFYPNGGPTDHANRTRG
jgi:hypothetical protein